MVHLRALLYPFVNGKSLETWGERDSEREREILGDPEVTVNIYFKSCNLPNTDTHNYGTDLRLLLGHPIYIVRLRIRSNRRSLKGAGGCADRLLMTYPLLSSYPVRNLNKILHSI